MGNIINMHLRIGKQDFVATIDSETKAKDGENLRVIFDMEKCHAFDPETEVAIF